MRDFFQHALDPNIHLRRRLFQLLSTIALAEFIIVTLYTAILNTSPLGVAVMLFGTFLFAMTVSLTFKSGRMRLGATISGLLYFSIYPLTFFSSGGIYGGGPPVAAFALIYVFLVTQNWERIVSLALCVLVDGCCWLAAYLHPELLTKRTVAMEHAESFLAVLLVTVLICTLFAFVTEVYAEENRIVQRQKKQIEDLNRAQKRFFSSMSHEIRTPVNAIIGFNESTLRENISEEVRENAHNIEVASKLLLHTINEILDMSRLETGGMEIVCADYRTTAMLSDIVSLVWLRAQEKGLEFVIRVDPAMPTSLHGDEVRIKQLLLNVVSNAVKYTREGSVTLAISGRTDEQGVFYAVYDVTDTGIGIREENIPQLFSAFQRVDEQSTHAIEGTGLGLSIVKQLLDMMGGSVTVTSEYGKGSNFHIEIPQQVADPTPVGEVNLHRTARDETVRRADAFADPKLSILAVDDTPMNLKVLTKLLKDTGVSLDTAASGTEALKRTSEKRYDLILMDHQMPGMDGIECLHRIREQSDGLNRGSRIVCLTANVGADMERLYMQEGFDGYLEKPIRGKVLETEIMRLVPDLTKGGQ